ncbi:MAG: hypothetical protein MK010_06300 [Erythrobacter sp.]|nr:hypothetical protein [Erythrobacter sp.]
MKGQRIGMVAALILLAVLVLAWFDGGEEPLRPIEAAVPVPDLAPSTRSGSAR